MRLLLIRRSKNPDKFCGTTNAVFSKTFEDVESAVRWYARARRTCYVWEIDTTPKNRGLFWRKLSSICDDIPSLVDDYFRNQEKQMYARIAFG